jgi:hypothetical protein
VQGQAELLQVVVALRANSRFATFLHGGQEQADQHRDNGDHHQQLDQRKGPAAGRVTAASHGTVTP